MFHNFISFFGDGFCISNFITFFYTEIYKRKILKKEFYKLFFLGLMGCGFGGAFPLLLVCLPQWLIWESYIPSFSPVFIVILSVFLLVEKN